MLSMMRGMASQAVGGNTSGETMEVTPHWLPRNVRLSHDFSDVQVLPVHSSAPSSFRDANMMEKIRQYCTDNFNASARPWRWMKNSQEQPMCAKAMSCSRVSWQHLLEEWQEYAQQFSDSQSYRDASPENLLRRFDQSVSNRFLRRWHQNCPMFSKCNPPPPDVQVAFTPTATISFEGRFIKAARW
jgi:hypothetical protein